MTDPLDLDALTAQNTDRELFRENTGIAAGPYYENSCFVTEDQSLGISVGGSVIVRSLSEWHALIDRVRELEARIDAVRALLPKPGSYLGSPGVVLADDILAALGGDDS